MLLIQSSGEVSPTQRYLPFVLGKPLEEIYMLGWKRISKARKGSSFTKTLRIYRAIEMPIATSANMRASTSLLNKLGVANSNLFPWTKAKARYATPRHQPTFMGKGEGKITFETMLCPYKISYLTQPKPWP